ncbi:MAG: phytoene/squalene synthase family protein [Ginsengibacter sp.]|jgi:phytoene/squalene synthetase
MKLLFDQLSNKVSAATTREYSTSFSLAIHCVSKKLRPAIYGIYGFVRLADEIVDSFEGYDKQYLLEKYKADTYEAIEQRISLNPVLNTFQQVVHEYNIAMEEIEQFMQSMEMDLQKVDYNESNYNEYILGSAEVVGLMCLHVFTHGCSDKFEELKPYAMKLGAAFQKVNFLRDMKDDYHLLGRVYFPYVDIRNFTFEVKNEIEEDIQNDFKEAFIGIKKLPATSKGGVYLAYIYYQTLFNKIKAMPPHRILSERIRIHNGKKFGLLVNTFVQHKMNII